MQQCIQEQEIEIRWLLETNRMFASLFEHEVSQLDLNNGKRLRSTVKLKSGSAGFHTLHPHDLGRADDVWFWRTESEQARRHARSG